MLFSQIGFVFFFVFLSVDFTSGSIRKTIFTVLSRSNFVQKIYLKYRDSINMLKMILK